MNKSLFIIINLTPLIKDSVKVNFTFRKVSIKSRISKLNATFTWPIRQRKLAFSFYVPSKIRFCRLMKYVLEHTRIGLHRQGVSGGFKREVTTTQRYPNV